ncbi:MULTISPECIES: hypothetical protein [unclassified Frankia]|uniref:hypothetical protein n=1 Tax=unclassified Frankia TaxID=2632575 RepID=UPI002AD52C5F|nr:MULTISPECIES: hypothetical protein [unclassified Frankia]
MPSPPAIGDAASLSRAGPSPKRSFPELLALRGGATGAEVADTGVGCVADASTGRADGAVVD